MTAADLAHYSSEWVTPISTAYRGWTVYELPPNGQGMAALGMLNLMEQFPLGQFGVGSVQAFHVMIEAKKLAYADMLRFDCDPHFGKVPLSGLLAKSYAADRARLIGYRARGITTSARARLRRWATIQPIYAWWIRRGTWFRTSRAITNRSARGSLRRGPVLRCKIAARCSASTTPAPTCWRDINAPCTRSFQLLWRRGDFADWCIWHLWEVGIKSQAHTPGLICFGHRGPRYRHPGRARSAPIHQDDV